MYRNGEIMDNCTIYDDDTVEAVPSTWIINNKYYWPPCQIEKIVAAIKNQVESNTCQPSYDVKIFRNNSYSQYKCVLKCIFLLVKYIIVFCHFNVNIYFNSYKYLFVFSDNYETTREKTKKAELTSELSTDTDNDNDNGRKRKIIRKKFSSSSDVENVEHTKLRTLPAMQGWF